MNVALGLASAPFSGVPDRHPFAIRARAGLYPLRRGGSRGRSRGLARTLYQDFFALARADGRRVVSAVTSPRNSGSIGFHRSMGFTAAGPVPDYDGPGRDLVVFERPL